MNGLVHYEVEILYETTFSSACGASSLKHSYTTYDEEVTCPKCLKALGYAVPEVSALPVPYTPISFDTDPETKRPRFAA